MKQYRNKLPKVEAFDLRKHVPQTASEKTNDLFYILYTLYRANSADERLTKLSLLKALFATTNKLGIEGKLKFLNTMFYVNTYGPFNNIFYRYLDELENAELLRVEERDVYLTAKGLSLISEILEELTLEERLRKVLIELQEKTLEYAKNPHVSIKQTHALKVIDATDGNVQKTIRELIEEIEPEKRFAKSTEFKYINPLIESNFTTVPLPNSTINKIETATAKITEADFESNESLDFLFP